MYDHATESSTRQNTKKSILSHPKMHKYIMKNTRLLHSCITVLLFLLVSEITITNAVPADSTGARQHSERPLLLHRALRDVATIMTANLVQENHKDVATSTETMLDQPQGQCLLDGVLIAGTSVECKKQVGCRAIQKTGHCCPDYKCDCEKDGKTYLNGDKLVDPETPCTVCYCKGGEILCSSAVCFHRDDCTPRYIPGRCCPEYDNCPVANKTIIALTSTSKPEVPMASVLNPSITIKEITKPTEIRITDENKAKPIHQMLKTSTTSTTAAPSTTSASTTVSSLENSTTIKSLTLIKVSETASHIEDPVKSTSTRNQEGTDFPETPAESPISQELQRVDSEPGNYSSKINIKREFMSGSTEGPLSGSYIETVSDFNSSELNFESTDADSNGFNSSILQTYTDIDPETAGSDNIYHIILSTDGPGDVLGKSTEGIAVPKLVSTTEGIYKDISTEGLTSSMNDLTTDTYLKITDSTTEILEALKSTESSLTEASISTTQHHVEDEDTALPMESNPAYPSLPEDDFSIRDVNLPLSEIDDTNEADLKYEQRGVKIASSNHKTLTKTKEDHVIDDGSGNGSDIIASMKDIDNEMFSSTTSNALELASENVQLMYSSEEISSAETTISNATDFKVKKIKNENLENESGSGDSLELSSEETIIGSEIDGGNGSGNGSEELISTKRSKKQKEREPTTPRPTRRSTVEIDIDELGDASGDGKLDPADDPKLDAESLKIDEKDNESIVQKEPGTTKNDIVTVKVDPTQDKTFEELDNKINIAA